MNNFKLTFDKKYLLVDASYFAHRIIHGIRISQPDFILETKQEMDNFESMLNNSLITLYNSLNNNNHQLIDNIIFAFDNKSWRKSVEPIRPYYLKENDTTPLGYKENRKEKKDSHVLNYDNFHICLNNFQTKIEKTITCINVEGAEADDILFLLTDKFNKENILSIIFCTDGDLNTLVNDNVIILKNIKSNKSPDGEFVISKNIFDYNFKEKSIMETMLGSQNDTSYFTDLFKIDITNGGTKKSNINRLPNINIYSPEIHKDLLIKCICGDSKDNIFPIFRWENSTGSRNMKVTETMINKAFEMFEDLSFNNENVAKCFEDSKLMSQIIVGLKNITKQENIDMKLVGNHYKHNLLMNKLCFENIPTIVNQKFNLKVLELENLIYNNDLTKLSTLNLSVNQTDSAKKLIFDSIPTENTNDLVNSILNS